MMTVGQRVNHEVFGMGTVIGIQEREWIKGIMDTPIVKVKFDNAERLVTRQRDVSMSRTIVESYMSSEYEFTEQSLEQHLVPEDVLDEEVTK